MPVVESPDEFIKHSFDYIIIGGGTAGLALAGRLSERPHLTVGVVEAGAAKLNDPSILTPAAFSTIVGNKDYDWLLKTVPQVRLLQVIICRITEKVSAWYKESCPCLSPW